MGSLRGPSLLSWLYQVYFKGGPDSTQGSWPPTRHRAAAPTPWCTAVTRATPHDDTHGPLFMAAGHGSCCSGSPRREGQGLHPRTRDRAGAGGLEWQLAGRHAGEPRVYTEISCPERLCAGLTISGMSVSDEASISYAESGAEVSAPSPPHTGGRGPGRGRAGRWGQHREETGTLSPREARGAVRRGPWRKLAKVTCRSRKPLARAGGTATGTVPALP